MDEDQIRGALATLEDERQQITAGLSQGGATFLSELQRYREIDYVMKDLAARLTDANPFHSAPMIPLASDVIEDAAPVDIKHEAYEAINAAVDREVSRGTVIAGGETSDIAPPKPRRGRENIIRFS